MDAPSGIDEPKVNEIFHKISRKVKISPAFQGSIALLESGALYMIGPIEAVERYFFKALSVDSRATRAEYWWATLFVALLTAAALVWDILAFLDMYRSRSLYWAYQRFDPYEYITPWIALICLVPTLTLTLRRLHDAGRSGWWYWIQVVPFIGWLWFLILMILPSEDRENEWGPAHGSPASSSRYNPDGTLRQRATDSYAVLLDLDRPRSPEEIAAHRAEIKDYYRSKVLNQVEA